MPSCIFCHKEADIQVDTDQIGFFICKEQACINNLPQHLKDNPWKTEACQTITLDIKGKAYTFKLDGRIIRSIPNKIKEILAK